MRLRARFFLNQPQNSKAFNLKTFFILCYQSCGQGKQVTSFGVPHNFTSWSVVCTPLDYSNCFTSFLHSSHVTHLISLIGGAKIIAWLRSGLVKKKCFQNAKLFFFSRDKKSALNESTIALTFLGMTIVWRYSTITKLLILTKGK